MSEAADNPIDAPCGPIGGHKNPAPQVRDSLCQRPVAE